MYLVREGEKASARASIKYQNLADYIGVLLDVYAALRLKREFWLTDSERSFLIATIIHVSSNYTNPICEESVQIYKEFFNPKVNKIKISDYINRVRKKLWIKYDTAEKHVELPVILKGIDINSDSFEFNIKLLYDKVNESGRIEDN